MTGDADRRSADDAAEADSLVDVRGVTVGRPPVGVAGHSECTSRVTSR